MEVSMTTSTATLQGRLFSEIRHVFYNPLRFVEHLQEQRTLKAWLSPLLVALLGYAIFGLSAASFRGGLSFLYAAALFPLLFVGSLVVVIPSLYIFDAFLGSRLHPRQLLAMGLAAFLVPGVLLAGMAPINWFFSVTVRSPEMVVLSNHLAIGLAAFLGYGEVMNMLQQLQPLQPRHLPPLPGPAPQTRKRPQPGTQRLILYLWLFLYLGILYKLMTLLLPVTGILFLQAP
jgi:hypothetical protein